jgi:hypothetical protein
MDITVTSGKELIPTLNRICAEYFSGLLEKVKNK